eukprot:1729076-Pyramimonas_sp.AAC.1
MVLYRSASAGPTRRAADVNQFVRFPGDDRDRYRCEDQPMHTALRHCVWGGKCWADVKLNRCPPLHLLQVRNRFRK